MTPIGKSFVGATLLTVAFSAGAAAQYYPSYADDMACRQWADQQVAPLRAQANTNVVGSTLGGAALGAALGAAIGGGVGAVTGAASGAIAGTGAGAANAQYDQATIQQWYNSYYSQCMAARTPRPPQPSYAQPQGYPPSPQAPSGYYPTYQPYPGYPTR